VSAAARRVLCYAPYNRWIQHAVWEMTIVHGLRARGADVRHVFCDGLYEECDVFWAATDPRPARACTQCQAEVTKHAWQMQAPFEWLGRHLLPAELREAQRWADLLPVDRYLTATYGEWALGQWVESSLHSHFRMTFLDLGRPDVRLAYRAYLRSALVACFGLTRLYDDYQPDVLFLFNGRMSSPRVALELARRRGIRVVVHERGLVPESLAIFENTHCLALAPIRNLWRDWGEIPLTGAQIETLRGYLAARAEGSGMSWPGFSPPPADLDLTRARLRLSAAQPVWALFTSADDEVVAEGDWGGPFPHQLDWIERTVAYAAQHPEIALVVRVHPNVGGRKSHGRNRAQLAALEGLGQRVPRNVRIVMPDDDVSSYSLMDLATVGLVYQSTVGLELACKGKTTVVAMGSIVSGLPFVHTVRDVATYARLLDGVLEQPPGATCPDIQRLAFRFAYAYFFRWMVPFPLVKMAKTGTVGLRYHSPDDLRPGVDPHLDRMARIVLDGEPVCLPPTADDLGTSAAGELALFGGERAPTGVVAVR
jgi:hypothetical protein